MSQHDMNVANQFFPAFRADMNLAFVALATNNAGDAAPGTTFEFMHWVDTSPSDHSLWMMRKEANDGWIKIGRLEGSNFTPYYQDTPLGNVVTANVGVATGEVPTADLVVLLAGATMTGPLTLSGNPIAQMHAATKEYVDNVTGVPTGGMIPYGGVTAPAGWLLCNGAQVSRTTEALLFSIIGTGYGIGDGTTTFNLPDGRDKTAVGVSGTKLLGSSGGAANITLATSNLPSHTHTGTTGAGSAHSHTGTTGPESNDHTHGYNNSATHPTGFQGGPNAHDATNAGASTSGTSTTHTHSFTTATEGAHTHGFTTGATGGGAAISVQNPYFAANWIIKK